MHKINMYIPLIKVMDLSTYPIKYLDALYCYPITLVIVPTHLINISMCYVRTYYKVLTSNIQDNWITLFYYIS